jgi:glycosyltransferase involved in cell wall biosynthesis
MTSRSAESSLPDVAVVTMRSGARPQKATYLLLNVLSELTTVSLVTVLLSEDSEIHGSYDVTEIAHGSKADGLLNTILLFIRNQLRLCRAIRGFDAPVVYFFGGVAYSLPIVFATLIGKTVVVQPRGDVPLTLRLEWEERYPDFVAQALANGVALLEFVSFLVADRIVTYTESMADKLGLGRFQKKLYTDGTRYIPLEDEFTPQTPIEERDRRVGMIGRLDIEKGIGELIKTVKRLPADVTFRFVGDGAYREAVEQQLAAEIEAGQVELTGWVDHDEIPAHLNDIRLLVLSSEPTEGLPTAIQEAFACGTPVYATPVSGIPSVVTEGKTGFLMQSRSPDQIAERVESILSREDLPEISETCRAFAVNKYSFEASVENFERLLTGLARE